MVNASLEEGTRFASLGTQRLLCLQKGVGFKFWWDQERMVNDPGERLLDCVDDADLDPLRSASVVGWAAQS